MSLARRLLLRASRSPWLAEQLRRRAFFRRAVWRFLPGEDLGAALDAAAEFARAGLGSVLTQLGEQVSNRAEAVAVRDHYLGVLAAVRQRRLPSQVSVKLTHLGLDVDRGACEQAVDALAARAEDSGSFLWIDMEEARYVDVTLEGFRAARGEHTNVGGWLPAYLRRPPPDLAPPLGPRAPIRLRSGAARARRRRVSRARVDQLRDRLVRLVHASPRRAAGEPLVRGQEPGIESAPALVPTRTRRSFPSNVPVTR